MTTPAVPPSSRGKYCPYCGTRIVHACEYCPECRRTFLEPPVGSAAPHPVKTYEPDNRKPWIAALLSLIGLGLGQFFNGETAKGILIFILAIAAFIMGGPLLSVDPILLVTGIWVIAVFDAFMSSKKINRLEKPFYKKSVLFWPEVGLIACIAGIIVFAAVFPVVTAHGVTLTAGALAETKYPEYSLPLYDTALSLSPQDTGILMQKMAVMQGLGMSEEVQSNLDQVMAANPNETAPIIMTGDLLFTKGDYEQSVSYYKKALAINSEDAQIWIKKGDAHLAIAIADMKKIRSQYRTLSYYDDNSTNASVYSMDAFRTTESYQEAVKAYNHAIRIDPFTSVEISGRILASTQVLLDTYQGILEDVGTANSTAG